MPKRKFEIGGCFFVILSPKNDQNGFFAWLSKKNVEAALECRIGTVKCRTPAMLLLYSVTKGVKRRASTMYFYITEYEQYIHSGSDPQIHNWLASGESILPLPS